MHIMSNCFSCKHLFWLTDKSKSIEVCKAFPNGVPKEVYTGKVLHTKPYPGDNGILFESVDS